MAIVPDPTVESRFPETLADWRYPFDLDDYFPIERSLWVRLSFAEGTKVIQELPSLVIAGATHCQGTNGIFVGPLREAPEWLANDSVVGGRMSSSA